MYVFCILTHTDAHPDGNFDMRFFLDGELDGQFVEAPTGKATWDYNVPVYHKEGLSNGPHTITLASGVLGGPNTLVLLDYMVFT